MPEEEDERAQHHSENDKGLLKKKKWSKTMARRVTPVGNMKSRPDG
uniref:Uncharacterized protein n=1 Tax=Peronospora matthiolae TaxID=2874970 RepID=A0AAV1UWT3_9STRA